MRYVYMYPYFNPPPPPSSFFSAGLVTGVYLARTESSEYSSTNPFVSDVFQVGKMSFHIGLQKSERKG